jgi:hypothetical protein
VITVKKNGALLAEWAVGKVEAEYKDDVCLLLEHKTLRLDKDQTETSFSYYIPATNRAYGLARTFIIAGIGYDLFPVPWERLERIADLGEYNTTILADAEILYTSTEADRLRFTGLQARQQTNLQNPQFTLNKAIDWLGTVQEIYEDMLFEEKLYKVRENAGHICNLLTVAVALANQKYLRHGQTNQLQELRTLPEIPAGFIDLYERIICARTADEQKRLCYDIILATKKFLNARHQNTAATTSAPDFTELAAWYHELSYTWRRVYHWCDAGDPINAYLWCCLLQNEVDKVGADFGIGDLDILGAFAADNLPTFRKRAATVEQKIVAALETHGVKIDAYPSVEAFLEQNR